MLEVTAWRASVRVMRGGRGGWALGGVEGAGGGVVEVGYGECWGHRTQTPLSYFPFIYTLSHLQTLGTILPAQLNKQSATRHSSWPHYLKYLEVSDLLSLTSGVPQG